MSILIKGMEMPKENDYTIAIVYGDGVVTEYHEDYWIRGADGEKQLGIAVPVPPHGDLIDRDKLEKDIDNYIGGEESRSRFHHWVQVQSVVIPGNKGAET